MGVGGAMSDWRRERVKSRAAKFRSPSGALLETNHGLSKMGAIRASSKARQIPGRCLVL